MHDKFPKKRHDRSLRCTLERDVRKLRCGIKRGADLKLGKPTLPDTVARRGDDAQKNGIGSVDDLDQAGEVPVNGEEQGG